MTDRLYFEDLEPGVTYRSPGRTITEADVVTFAGLSGDYNALHTDEEFARTSVFGRRVAHGLLGTIVATGLQLRTPLSSLATMAFLEVQWKFQAPIFFGDTIHLLVSVAEKKATSKADRGIVVTRRELVNQRNEVVQTGLSTLMVQRRPPSAEPANV